jgi:hypothetical protein
MRYRALPHSLEGVGAGRDDIRGVRQVITQELAVSVEVAEPDEPVIEYPEIAQWDEQARGLVPGKPPHLLARVNVRSRGLILEADVLGQRF